MLSIQERQYIHNYAQNQYSGLGEIVDLGCWLGGSSVALVTGLQENPNLELRQKIIHAYDLFVWESWMDPFVVDTPLQGLYKSGDSFLPECQRGISQWEQQIKLYPGDLDKIGWQGNDIEFLFIDAMKSWQLANSILTKFVSCLIPQHSVIIHQDFSHFGTYWIHLVMYRLRSYFEPIYDIPDSWSLVFQYKKNIPKDVLMQSYSLYSFDRDEINAAFEYSQELVSSQKRAQIIGAKAIALIELGDFYAAKKELEQSISDGLSYADLQPSLGLGLPSLILNYIDASGILAQPTVKEIKTEDIIQKHTQLSQKQLGDLQYSGERHMADQVGLALSLSHIDHMVRYAFAAPFAKERRVLDITCGSGYGTQFMAIQGGKEVIGVDIDSSAIAYARKHYEHPNVSYIESDAHNVPQLESGSFDTIISFETIEHLHSPLDFLLELRRLLKPNGCLIISCPNDYRVSPWISEYHLHKFRFTEFRDLIVNVFGEASFLFQYNTATSCLLKPLLVKETSSRFESYRDSLSVDNGFFEKQYLDGLFTVDNSLGYLAIVGVDSAQLTSCMSISQTAFQDVMSSLHFTTEEVKRLSGDLQTLSSQLSTREQSLSTREQLVKSQTGEGRIWHLKQSLKYLQKALFNPKSNVS